MEKLSEGETKVDDDPRSMRNMRKESVRRRVHRVLGLMRGASHVNVAHRDLEIGYTGGLLAFAHDCSAC